MRQTPRNIKRAYRRKIAKATNLLATKEVVKEEVEIAKVRVLLILLLLLIAHYTYFLQIFSRIP